MSFNALSLAKIGIGFGVLAVASIGLLTPAPADADQAGGIQPPRRELPAYAPPLYILTDAATAKTQESETAELKPFVVLIATASGTESEHDQTGATIAIKSRAASKEKERAVSGQAAMLDAARINAMDEQILLLI